MINEDYNYFLILGIPPLSMIYTFFHSILRGFVCLLDKLNHSKGMKLWLVISKNLTALKTGLDDSALCQKGTWYLCFYLLTHFLKTVSLPL